MLTFFANLDPCTLGLEACAGAHHWARELSKLGHQVRLIHPRFVTPYRKSDKNDRNDAEAICEALTRPSMRFVAMKSPEQQALLSVHRARSLLSRQRIDLMNQIRGLLAEYDRRLRLLARQNPITRRLMQLPGIGPLTATALVASAGDLSVFGNARQFAAWLGLVPRHYASGGKCRTGRITKRGDAYLRTLLVHGARAALRRAHRREDGLAQWALAVKDRRGPNKAAVALAAKHARILWAMLTREVDYQPRPVSA